MAVQFKSVGGAMTDELSRALVEREIKRRQDMLDSLAVQREQRLNAQTAANTEVARENAAGLKEVRESTVAARQQQQSDAERKAFEGSKQIGDELTDDEAKKFPALALPAQPVQGAHLGVDEQGVDQYAVSQGHRTYKGNDVQRQKAEQRQQIEGMINSNPELADHPGVKAALQMASITGDYSGLYGALAQMTKATTPETRSVGGYLHEKQADGTWKKVAEGRAPADRTTLSATSEGAMINRLQTQWDRAQKGPKEMERQFHLMQTGLDRFRNGDTNGGSQAVLVTFQKILDPISVVRESEYARSAQGLGLLQRMEGFLQKHLGVLKAGPGGAGVPPEELGAMVETARQFLEASKHAADGARARTARTAARYGIPEDLVFDDAEPSGGAHGSAETPEQRRKRLYDQFSQQP